MGPIQRRFAPDSTSPNSYENLKRERQPLLEAGIARFKSIGEVITEIRNPSNDDPLFISKNSFWGPDIPKSAQKLLAAMYIKEFRWGAFDFHGEFNYAAFEAHLNRVDPFISRALKPTYFANIRLVSEHSGPKVRLAYPGHDYALTMELPPPGIAHIRDFIISILSGYQEFGRHLSTKERDHVKSTLLNVKLNEEGQPVVGEYNQVIEKHTVSLGQCSIRFDGGKWALVENEENSPKPPIHLNTIDLHKIQRYIWKWRLEQGEKNLAKAVLSCLELGKINLRNVNLYSADLHRTMLRYADLSGANLINACLYFCDLSRVNLSDANLTWANSSYANLVFANLIGADFSGADLRYADLSCADLSNVKLRNAKLTCAILRNAKLHGADLSGARLDASGLIGINLQGVILNEATRIDFGRFDWDSDSLDQYLNHRTNPSGTLLTAIDSIDDAYLDLKRQFLVQLIDSLEYDDVDISSVKNCLRVILCDKKYLEHPRILEFVRDKVLGATIVSANHGQLAVMEPRELALFLSIAKISMDTDQDWAFLNNCFFVQLIRMCFSLPDNFQNVDDALRKQARDLYDKYLQSDGVLEIFKKIQMDFGGETPYIFFCKQPDGISKSLVVTEEEMANMLRSEVGCRYTDYYYFVNGEIVPTSELKPGKIFDTFKIFSAAYRFATSLSAFTDFLTLLNLQYNNAENEVTLLTKDYKKVFADAQLAERCETKLVEPVDQNTLKEIFYRLLESTNGLREEESVDEFKTEHLNAIYNVFNIGAENDIIKAKWLYALAAKMFMYSSSHIFGTEIDSPVAIRYYAAGLVRAAHRLDSSIFGELSQYKDIMDRATGKGNAFSCTAVLTGKMMTLAKRDKDFNAISKSIFPPTWLKWCA